MRQLGETLNSLISSCISVHTGVYGLLLTADVGAVQMEPHCGPGGTRILLLQDCRKYVTFVRPCFMGMWTLVTVHSCVTYECLTLCIDIFVYFKKMSWPNLMIISYE